MADRTTHLGKYRLIEKLGAGTTGAVYKAVQEPLGRVVAIKVLSRAHLSDGAARKRFEMEARVAVTLNHPHIVRGLDFGEADGRHYFVMEFVDGRSVADRLTREGRLEEREAFRIVRQVAEGLGHAAEYDLVHRDVKPQNVLLTAGGDAKLCDLGLASVAPLETSDPTADAASIGTPHYMAPERIRGREDAGRQSDEYSLGATAFHMLTGRPPFPGRTVADIARLHLERPAPDPREVEPGISGAAAAIVLKMLAKDPARRYSSYDDLCEDLRAVETGRPPLHAISVGQGAGASRRFRKRRSLTPLLALVFAVLAAGAAYLLLDPFGTRTPAAGPDVAPVVPTADTGELRVADGTQDGPPPVAPIVPKPPPPDPDAVRAREEKARLAAEREAVALAKREEEEGRAGEQAAFDDTVLQAVSLARGGDHGGAIRFLDEQGDVLRWHREDLEAVVKMVRDALRFREAIREGALTHEGRHVALDLLDVPGRSLHGLVYGTKDKGIEVAAGGLRKVVPLADLTPGCRLRLAFAVLDRDAPEDRAAAAGDLLLDGFLSEAAVEIEAARAGGSPVEHLDRLSTLVEAHEQEQVARVFEETSKLAKAEDPEAALARIEQGVREFPANAALRLLLGAMLGSEGESTRALGQLRRARGLGLKDPDLALELGMCHLELGDEAEAERELTAALEGSDRDSEVAGRAEQLLDDIRSRRRDAQAEKLMADAEAARRGKDWQTAARLYEQLFDMDPSRTIALFRAGTSHIKARQLVAGYRALRTYLTVEEKGPKILEAKRAVRDLERKHRDVKGVEDLVKRASDLLEVEKAEEAEEIFADAVRVAPLHAEARQGRGYALLSLFAGDGDRKRLSAALADFAAAIEIQPDMIEAEEGKLTCLLELGQLEEGERTAILAVSRHPERWLLWDLAGRVAFAQENAAKAVERFGEGINRAPEQADLYIHRALAYDALGRLKSARGDLNKALDCSPNRRQIELIGEILQGLRR